MASYSFATSDRVLMPDEIRFGRVADTMLFSTVEIPDHLPPLRKGIGRSPDAGGCLMQVTNYLATGAWTDAPGS